MNLSKFSERLSELIFEAGLNAHTFASKLGCGENTIYAYIQRKRFPTLKMLVLIADYFECSADFLLGLEEENYSRYYEKCPSFRERFPALLSQCGISQYRLEKETKISHSTMVCWKNGKKEPTVESIVRISAALDRTVDFVLGRSKS